MRNLYHYIMKLLCLRIGYVDKTVEKVVEKAELITQAELDYWYNHSKEGN